MPSYILGIDIGTGSTKAVAMGTGGNVLATVKQHYPIQQPHAGHSEQDPEQIYQAFIKCVADVVGQLRSSPEGISFSCVMHSLIPVDADGNALAPMMTWADTRAEHIAQSIRDSVGGEHIYRTSGTPIHPMSPLCKLIWLKDNQPELFNSAHKFISIKEYIWHKVFGIFEVDYSVASGNGLFDIIRLKWSREICNFAGVDSNKLSEPVDTTYIRSGMKPDVAAILNIPAETKLIIGATDGCCANLGSLAIAPGTAALTIGTSGAVRVTGNKPVYNFGSMTFNYLLDGKTYISGGAVNNGGIAVNWLLSSFLNITGIGSKDYDNLFNEIARIPAGSDGLVFLPYLYGERAPLWDAGASGAYLNVKPVHTQAHFLRAGLEGICFTLKDVLQTLEASVQINQLNVSGGFVSSDVWMQLLADITGKTLVMLQLEDASAIGAVYLAMQVLYPGTDLSAPEQFSVVEPNMSNHRLYAQTFPIFKQLYADTRASMRQLNQLNN
ncbi:gluconokinase [Mucilaginibacter mali]|uniref:Gluconokinase n=1 Tax=Mucilaginibacter mali TaxID=2740462 RepID=A0A7D4QWV4_9SPHI|nr:gluconokinase [Mucilaginibacter mali]QKJ32529.1 gluconokinase [Mucilaginibacter mali]